MLALLAASALATLGTYTYAEKPSGEGYSGRIQVDDRVGYQFTYATQAEVCSVTTFSGERGEAKRIKGPLKVGRTYRASGTVRGQTPSQEGSTTYAVTLRVLSRRKIKATVRWSNTVTRKDGAPDSACSRSLSRTFTLRQG